MSEQLPCVVFEDEHLLVVNKPAGINTHAPAPFAGEGIYDWLRNREPRWATLAIIHRLDKETSGVLVFSKTALANRSLTEQFTRREVRKGYLLLTDRPVQFEHWTARSGIIRSGERYRSSATSGEPAETRFKHLRSASGQSWIAATPVTGRTHQIRVHAADHGVPILGDRLYGGTPAPRVYLHAEQMDLRHPASGEPLTFRAEASFEKHPGLRHGLMDPATTDSYRLLHGAADSFPGWYVDRFADFLLSQSEQPLTPAQLSKLEELLAEAGAKGAYHKILNKHVRGTAREDPSPRHVLGEPAPESFVILENGVRFEIRFSEGYSVGLFLDQRDNRRRLLSRHIASGWTPLPQEGDWEVLNAFAYTCGFSICAALAGASTTSLDLSRRYLEWGRRNFQLNGIDLGKQDFIYGDVFEWFKRLARKGRKFDVIILDPPTFSTSKTHGPFQAGKDYQELILATLPLLKPAGTLLASTNAARLAPESFLRQIHDGVLESGRTVRAEKYYPQPIDFPIDRAEPAYLKTVWLRA